jgi:hypothetical protein
MTKNIPPLPEGLSYPDAKWSVSRLRGKPDGIVNFLRHEWTLLFKAGFNLDWKTLQSVDYRAWLDLESYLRRQELPPDIPYIRREVLPKAVVTMDAITKDELLAHPIFSYRLDDFLFSTRDQNAFSNSNIVFLGELLFLSKKEFLGIPNLGTKSLEAIGDILSSLGFDKWDVLETSYEQQRELKRVWQAKRAARDNIFGEIQSGSINHGDQIQQHEAACFDAVKDKLRPEIREFFANAGNAAPVDKDAELYAQLRQAAEGILKLDIRARHAPMRDIVDQEPGLLNLLTVSEMHVVQLCLFGITPDNRNVPSLLSQPKEIFGEFSKILGISASQVKTHLQKSVFVISCFLRHDRDKYQNIICLLDQAPSLLNRLSDNQSRTLQLCLLGRDNECISVPSIVSPSRLSFDEYARRLNTSHAGLSNRLNNAVFALQRFRLGN